MIRTRIWVTWLAILIITILAFGLRMRAVNQLPIDYDEDDYLAAAQRYSSAIRAGDLQAIIDYDFNYEHPPLTKLAYAVAILSLPEVELIPELPASASPARDLPEPHFNNARMLSTVFSTLQVLLLAIFNPLAGLLLGVNTWQIKYTSQIMLEPLPALLSTIAVLLYARSNRRWGPSLILASVFFGLTVAAKYPYVVAGIAILVHWLAETYPGEGIRRPGAVIRWLRPVFAWGVLAVVIFFAANPRLWNDPFNRLWATVSFHSAYATSDQVQQAGFPFWQPFVWLFFSVPWHPGVFLISIDIIFTLLAIAGFRRLWQRYKVFALWLAIGLTFLIFWPTKWPQYILILTTPLSLAAAEGFQANLWEPYVNWWGKLKARKLKFGNPQHWGWERLRSEVWRAFPWLFPGTLVLGLIAVYPMLFQGAMSLTDFSASAIRDGLNGGVWRAVGEGLSGQAEPVEVQVFEPSSRRTVSYAGPSLITHLIFGAVADLVVFNLLWTVLAVIGQTALGVWVAIILQRQGVRFRNWWRALFILPWAVPEFVGALIWSQVFDPRFGWAQQAAATWYERGDYPGAVNFFASWQENPNLALFVLLITAIWYGFPFMMLAATAGLKFISREVYDAAAMDGAGPWTQFRFITWPMLLPLMAPAIIIRSIFSFNQFYIFYVMNPPYPLQTFSITSFFFFDGGGQYAVSAALNIFTLIVLVLLILWFNRWSKASEGVTYA